MTGNHRSLVFDDILILSSMNSAIVKSKHYILLNMINHLINVAWIQFLNSTGIINLNITNNC